MTNPFDSAGSASNIFWLFPKIKSTLQRRGHVNSEDASENVLRVAADEPKGKVHKVFESVNSLPGL